MRKFIFILGMHRSGTSATGIVLSKLGVSFGPYLMEAKENENPLGFWEDEYLVYLHDELLYELGSTWHDILELPKDWQHSPAAQATAKKIKQHLMQHYVGHDLWAIKDPRMCLLLPLWKPLFEDLEINPSYAILYRHPTAVFHSLNRRNGFTEEKSALLWLRYNAAALQHSAHENACCICYDNLLEDAYAQVVKLGHLLHDNDEWPWPTNQEKALRGISESLQARLNHSPELSKEPTICIPPENNAMIDTWNLLKQRENGQPLNIDVLKKTAAKLQCYQHEFSSLLSSHCHDLVHSLVEQRTWNAKRIEDLQLALNQQEQQTRINEAQKEEIGTQLEEERDLRQAETDTYKRHLAESSEKMTILESKLTDYRDELSDYHEKVDNLTCTLKQRDETICAQQCHIHTIQGSISWRITKPLRCIFDCFYRIFRRHLEPPALLSCFSSAKKITALHLCYANRTSLSHRYLAYDQKRRMQQLALSGDDNEFDFEPQGQDDLAANSDVRLIAFYLPQYHTIPENDKWWGKGFTEWTNVRKSRSQLVGHRQPEEPHPEIGYYDLSNPEVLEKQAALARAHGIYGFCYHYYWFNGKRLLEKPVDTMLASGKPNMPFCLCWANENWTRRWDGKEHAILIAQEHSPEIDRHFIMDILPFFRDPRYIRQNGRPVLIVYRPMLLPEPAKTIERWRKVCRKEGIGEIYVCGARIFGLYEAEKYGLDAMVEFPPNDSGVEPLCYSYAGAKKDFKGLIYDYRQVRENLLTRQPEHEFIYRGVTPCWDNTPRRNEAANIFINSSPGAYYNWLIRTMDLARRETENDLTPMVFINAWNEWAEGCHLEPDGLHGFANLNATKAAIEHAGTKR